jgi:alpha-galactosidase
MSSLTYDFSNHHFDMLLKQVGSHLYLEKLAVAESSWLHPSINSGLFAVTIDDQPYDALNLAFIGGRAVSSVENVRHLILSFQGEDFMIDQNVKVYSDSAVLECWPVIHNQGQAPIKVQRIDSFVLTIPAVDADLLCFTGDWGSEFEPHQTRLSGEVTLESRSGRSSKGNHPWFSLTRSSGSVLSGAVAWSGNWVLRFEPLAEGGHRVSGGLHDWRFSKILQPGETMDGVPVVSVLGKSMDEVSQQYARVGRDHWYPHNALSACLPVEWNHWWPYEDAELNEVVFAENIEKAAQLGFEVCTLDAGWFGPSDAGTFWEHYRGDWHIVNQARFPNGIRPLADLTHARGMKFGIWCEIEALGPKAQLAKDHPEYIAMREGERLGCVCFGNPDVQEWAYQTLARLINEYNCDWIKVDFNLDPGAGCSRTDHGHQSEDGLYEHYRGYYRTLERIHDDFPEVVLENCSSGGLRIDLGILRRTHMTFLSDPDWPDHDLQIFWGASTMLAPNVLLHWTYSHWRNINPPPYQTFNPHDPALTEKKWDYYSRISMLGQYGISQKLPELPEWMEKRMGKHNQIYKNHVRRFTKEANFFRLTDQPRRSGEGERWAAFQYSLPAESEHLLFVFRLPGAEQERSILLKDLQPDRTYHIQGFENECHLQQTGRSLMEEGLLFSRLEEEDSALLKIS